MHEVGSSPRAGEGGDQLLTDQACFADAGDDDASGCISNELHRIAKAGVKIVRQTTERLGFLANDSPRFAQLLWIVDRDDRASL